MSRASARVDRARELAASALTLFCVGCATLSVAGWLGCSPDEQAAEPSASLPAARERPDLLLVTVDTLRADHLGSYGYHLPTSPNLDTLARDGVRFADASVQWPSTWPSMASMMTGLYPNQTGVRHRPRVPLASGHETLAERLARAGYQTGAVVSNVNLGKKMGFDQGFDFFVESWVAEFRRRGNQGEFQNRPGLVKIYTDARRVTDQALDWLRSRDPERPFFLWIHYMDPHGPYIPPDAYLDLFPDAHERNVTRVDAIPAYQRQRVGPQGLYQADLAYYKRRYDQEIRYFDDQLARVLAAVEGLPRPPLFALTADHGESLDEHGYLLEHGANPFQPNTRVPLILRWPGRIPAGRVVTEPVGMVQLVPSLLELMGEAAVAAESTAFGAESFAAAARGVGPVPDGDLFLQSGTAELEQWSLRRGRFKLVHLRSPEDRRWMRRGEFALYDLEQDPQESKDVSALHPQLFQALRESLASFVASQPAPRAGGEAALTDGEREMLRALGYLEDDPIEEDSESR